MGQCDVWPVGGDIGPGWGMTVRGMANRDARAGASTRSIALTEAPAK
jgi:hypothetical protein